MNLELVLETPNFNYGEEVRRKWWPIRPFTSILWADILWILVVGSIDAHILPALTLGILPFNLLVPWVVLTVIVAPATYSLILISVCALLMETGSAAPRGLYMTSFWVIYSVLQLTRKTLSWRHAVPWLVTFFVSSFFISNFESLLIFLRQDPTQLDFFHFAKQVIRVILCVIVGMTFAQPWMARYKGESQSP